jgi:hypothetical protein
MHKTIITIGILGAFFLAIIPSTESYIAPTEDSLSIKSIETVEDAKEYIQNFYPELAQVAQCESSWRKDASNSKSSATGIFQFLDGTANWVHGKIYDSELSPEMKNDPALQVEMAVWLYERYGLAHWQYPCGTLHA